MDFNKLIARVKNILLTPKTEWPVIAGETETVQSLYLNYILVLAAVPVVAHFIKFSILGIGGFGFGFREGIGTGIERTIVHYALTLGMVFVSALIADLPAPNFGSPKIQIQALKAVAYGWTASWVAGIGMILGVWLGSLLALAAFIYSIYLFNLGLKETMKCPPEKAAGHTAVTVILTIVATILINLVVLRPMGLGYGYGYGYGTHHFGLNSSGSVDFDKSGALGALAAAGQRAAEAGKKMEAAQKSGDANAQAQAAGQVIGAVLGGGAQVEALAPDALKPFVPDTLGGMPRTSFEAQKQAPIGVQVSLAEARYGNNTEGSPSYELTITDMGGAKGMMALAGFANIEQEKQTESGWEKTSHQGGRLVHEKWDNSGHGEYTIVLGDRFVVMVKGSRVANIDAIKAALGGVNLAGLEALKAQGVKNG